MDKTMGLLDKIFTYAIYSVFRLRTAERSWHGLRLFTVEPHVSCVNESVGFLVSMFAECLFDFPGLTGENHVAERVEAFARADFSHLFAYTVIVSGR